MKSNDINRLSRVSTCLGCMRSPVQIGSRRPFLTPRFNSRYTLENTPKSPSAICLYFKLFYCVLRAEFVQNSGNWRARFYATYGAFNHRRFYHRKDTGSLVKGVSNGTSKS